MNVEQIAPLAPNAWLRYDAFVRMLPPGIHDVLEVGCGRGGFGARLAQRYNYLGLEPDPTSFAVAQGRIAALGRGEVRNEFVEALGDDERFDLVCAFEVLEHIEDDAGALKSWMTRLRPGGYFMMSVPAHQHRFSDADTMAGHFRRYDPPKLDALLRSVGFAEVDLRLYGVPLGYVLEAGRNALGRRKVAATPNMTIEERTATSGRLFQPSSAASAMVTRWGTAPFRVLQRGFRTKGTGLLAKARLPH
jgi:SAM-dependent methyltransferase